MVDKTKTADELKQEFDRVRDDIEDLSGMDGENFKNSVVVILRHLVTLLETATIQQIAAHETSSKTFQSIGDAIQTIMHILKQKQT